MKKNYWILQLILISYFNICIAQKPTIDVAATDRWPLVEKPLLSKDGEYLIYKVFSHQGLSEGMAEIHIKSLHSSWSFDSKVPSYSILSFVEDDKLVIIQKSADSVQIIKLGNNEKIYLTQVISFKLQKNGRKRWFAYQSKQRMGVLCLLDLKTKQLYSFDNIVQYQFSENDKNLLLVKNEKIHGRNTSSLQLLDISTMKLHTIWSDKMSYGKNVLIKNFVFSSNGDKFCYIREENEQNTIWYYKRGMDRSIMIAEVEFLDQNNEFKITQLLHFDGAGKRLFCSIAKRTNFDISKNPVKVDIWAYKDIKLQSLQLSEMDEPISYLAVLNIDNGSVVKLTRAANEEKISSTFEQEKEQFIVIKQEKGDEYESSWNENSKKYIYLVSIDNGNRRSVVSGPTKEIRCYGMSPCERFILYYDGRERNFFTYEVFSGVVRNVTRMVNTQWTTYEYNDVPDSISFPAGVPQWIEDDSGILIRDQFDIWLIDPKGEKPAINITNFYGRRNNIYFQVAINRKAINPKEKNIILTAFNRVNKDNGFYKANLYSVRDPIKLTMGPYLYNINISLFSPIKAKDKDVYVVRRQSAMESPNYFWTSNFSSYHKITDFHLEDKYNWMKAELYNFKTISGQQTQGILYKPENFDPNKRYPIIFNFYERMTDRLNEFLVPALAQGDINIPWFVSRGYLVFTPDVYFQVGKPGESFYTTLLGAVKYLSNFGWVDTTRMGLQGHSFGAYAVNYMITHSGIFSAAVSASGACDIISLYASGNQNGRSIQFYERDQGRMGGSLWERREQYIENSPILYADKVSTPLLMMNNKNDHWGLFNQGVEFFTSLRRLNKRVWMLQYDGEGHSLGNRDAQMDYTIRMTQFFDHYLKAKKAPIWMIEGVDANEKGSIENKSLELSNGTP